MNRRNPNSLSRARAGIDPACLCLRAFTLIELLTVIAIIGILAAIIFPAYAAVTKHANKAAVKAQFGQWTQALQMFHTDYHHYPQIDGVQPDGGQIMGLPEPANILNPLKFAIALTGQQIDGTPLPPTASATELVGNTKRRSYYSISQQELVRPAGLQDAFGNTFLAVLYDSNEDGFITSDDIVYGGASQSAPALRAANGSTYTPDPVNDVNLVQGIRAGIIFYSPGPGNPNGGEIDSNSVVFSWK